MKKRSIQTLCVFCGSSDGNGEDYIKAAEALATEMSARGIHLVYGGGGAGIMGKLSQQLHESRVKVTGIIPKRLYEMVAHLHHAEDELIVVETMHERKATMYERSDAFVALPGGIGTLEELMEAMTWLQLGYHAKPVGMLNVEGFFDPLLAMLEHMVQEGFLRQVLVDALIVEQEPGILLDRLENIDLKLPGKITT